MTFQLDLGTILITHFIGDFITLIAMLSLWVQNRRRYAGIDCWMMSASFMAVGELLLTLRQVVPENLSILLGNGFLMAGAMMFYFGLARFSGTSIRRRIAFPHLFGYYFAFFYFTCIAPDARLRAILFSIVILHYTLLSFWVLLQNREHKLRFGYGMLGVALLLFAGAYGVRIGFLLLGGMAFDIYQASMAEAAIMLASQVLTVGLAVAQIMIVNRRLIGELEAEAHEKELILADLRVQARIDGLTGLLNRATVESKLRFEHRRNARFHRPFSIILIDVDHFKDINDSHGHQVGDEVLRQTAALLRDSLREFDVLGRWGGEEFLAICLESGADEMHIIAERLRANVAVYDFSLAQPVTISLGLAAWNHSESVEELIERADRNLYEAKARGRNRAIG